MFELNIPDYFVKCSPAPNSSGSSIPDAVLHIPEAGIILFVCMFSYLLSFSPH